MGWVSPTSHSDPLGGWDNETNAYDGVIGTYASGGGGGRDLRLSLGSDITTYKVRIYASTFTGGDVSDVSVGYSAWKYWNGTIPALTWFEIEFNTLLKISSVVLYRATGWRIYEFQFWDGADGYQPPASEDYIVENESVIEDALLSQMQRKLVIGPDGRIHCVFRKYLLTTDVWKVYYAYSDDYGKTWTVEDPAPTLTHYQYTPSIAVDSSGNPHVVLYHTPAGASIAKYLKKTGGSWTISDIYIGSRVERRGGNPWDFTAGDEVKGLTSGAIKIITFVFNVSGTRKLFSFSPGTGLGFIANEIISNQTNPGNTVTYLNECGTDGETALSIKSNDDLVLVTYGIGSYTWYWVKPSSSSSFRHATGWVGNGSQIAVDVSPNNGTHMVYRNGDSYYYGAIDQLICTGDHSGASYPFPYFSIATDSDNNPHFVVAQTGLGGAFPARINIKYYKRMSGVWSGPIHITDVDWDQGNPSISIDTQGRIHIMWQGKGWGTYPSRYSLLMRTYNGAWGATQVILNEDKDQGKYGASLLHAWHPSSNRLREPVYIFCRQGSWKIQFGGDLSYGVGTPDNLLCEQTKNPTNVSDPNPEFSAIYRSA